MPLALSLDEKRELGKLLRHWANDPVAFVYEVFGPGYEEETGKPLDLDHWQLKTLRALVPHDAHGSCDGTRGHRRIVVKACKGPGKTALLAWVGWWRLLICRHHRGAALSITGGNLRSNLWPELALWQRYSPLLSRLFEHKGDSIASRDHPKTWWLQARAFAEDADKSRQAETLAGLHNDYVTILPDEVGSYPYGVIDAANAIFNVKDQDCLIVAAGNATDLDGALFKICTEDADDWYIVEITGDPDDPDRSPRIDIDEARRLIAKRGRTDPVVMVNILGKFPPRGGNKLLGPDDVTAAMRRRVHPRAHERDPWVWGLDVAGEGLDPDEAVLYKRQGALLMAPLVWWNIATDLLAEKVAFEYQRDKKAGKAPKKIFVDRGGIGRGTRDRLRTLLTGEVVVGVDFGENALDEEEYADRRTEMWCLGAEWVRHVGCLPDVPELRRDLTAPNIGTESNTSHGTRRLLESKKKMLARGLPSPDHGDGFCLTFAAPVVSDAMDQALGRTGGTVETEFDPWEALRT
jgi:phage terminase large subunit